MLALSGAEYYILLVIGCALALIISNRLPPDLVALLVLLALGFSGIITLEQTLSGFSSSAVITIIGLFVMTTALERTGVIRRLSERLAYLSGQTEARMVIVLMSTGALLSLVVNNIAAGAVLLPAALRLAHQASIRPSKVLLPLAFGTLVGGMATLFTTANILLSAFLQQQGQRPLTMFDFLLSGGLVCLAGIAYMVLIGRRLLPDRESPVHTGAYIDTTPDLSTTYQLEERLWDAFVLPGSPLIGRTVGASGIGADMGIVVLAILRDQQAWISLDPQERIEPNDVLLIIGREERVRQLEPLTFQIRPTRQDVQELLLASLPPHEVIIAPRAPMIGQTLTDIRLRTRFGLTAVALWRGNRSYRTDVGKMPLQAGDALLMIGPRTSLQGLAQEEGYIVPAIRQYPQPRAQQARRATLIAAAAIGVSIVGWLPTPEAMLSGAVALVLAGCLRMEEFYTAVEWRIVFLIAGMTPISAALQTTGLADRFSELCIALFAPFGPLGLIAGFYLFTFLVVQMMGGQVTALIIGPLAISAALQAGVNPAAMGVTVSIACSAAFLTPVAHPVNLLMMSPGGYTGGDFLRVGSGISLVCFLATMASMWLFWEL